MSKRHIIEVKNLVKNYKDLVAVNDASFSVNRDDNYWHCFSGCGGGDIISFYMTYQQRVENRDCDFKTAVTELAEMLLK